MSTDRKRSLQVILNALSNSVKYTERDSVKVQVVDAADSIILTVEDTGIGIDINSMKKLFLPFERLESNLRVKVPATGLGLYLTRKIMTEILNGSINVVSELDKGSTFMMTFPKVLVAESLLKAVK